MKYLIICFCLCFVFILCDFSVFRKTEESTNLPHSFIQEPASFPTDNPEEIQKQLTLIAQRYSSKAIEWWILYKKALIFQKKDPELFCHNMRFLSQIDGFPLQYQAHLNLYVHCNADIKIDLSYFPEWMKKKITKEWNKKARASKNKKEIMESSYYMYELSEDKNIRERHLVKAINLAKELEDERLETWRKKLQILSPRYISNPSHSQKLIVANDFKHVRRFKKAVFYYRQLLNNSQSSFHDKNEAFKKIRWVYKVQKNNKKYLTATIQWKNWLKRKMKKEKKAMSTYHNISFLLARTQWTLNQSSKALSTLRQIEKELQGRFSLFQVYRMKALIFEEKNDLDKSIFFFEKALKEKFYNREVREKTKWSYAWVLKKVGKKEASINVLKELLETTKSDYLPSRILFWIGRTYEDMKEEKKAQTTYKKLITKDPLSYYGFLAHYKLNYQIKIDQKKNFSQEKDDTDYTIVQWLLSLNEYDSALDFLKYKSNQYQTDLDKKAKEWATLFYYMAMARSHFPLFKMVGNLPVEERTVFFRSYTDLMFPIIYTKEVEKAARLFNVEKEFIYALIRQESAWNPKARSPADAFGLMQIRPFVARKVARTNGVSYKNMYDLYKPQKNIILGTAFLKQLFDKYNSQFITTVAVYNAGRTAVLRWLKQKPPEKDPLSFIEEIPYEETRTYVRLLIRNIIFYKLLTHPERKAFFPNWILNMQPPSK